MCFFLLLTMDDCWILFFFRVSLGFLYECLPLKIFNGTPGSTLFLTHVSVAPHIFTKLGTNLRYPKVAQTSIQFFRKSWVTQLSCGLRHSHSCRSATLFRSGSLSQSIRRHDCVKPRPCMPHRRLRTKTNKIEQSCQNSCSNYTWFSLFEKQIKRFVSAVGCPSNTFYCSTIQS